MAAERTHRWGSVTGAFPSLDVMGEVMGRDKRVLLVEDDDDVRNAIADRLTHSGFVVSEAADGFMALAEMRIRHFDVMVTDYNMPLLSGPDFLRRCRQDYPSTPIIVLTAGSIAKEELAAIGTFACIEKPFDADRLVALVCRSAGLPPPAAANPTAG